jgi:hypothetical protein
VDAGFVLLFALIGRISHVKGVTVLGVVDTAWPFLVGLTLGWVAARLLWRDWPHGIAQAVPVWLVTVAVGLLLRVASGGGGAPLSFVIVATVVLGTFMLGWRVRPPGTIRVARRRTPGGRATEGPS